MIPKKIYISQTVADDIDRCGKSYRGEVVADATIDNPIEYTHLPSIWHDASEMPTQDRVVLVLPMLTTMRPYCVDGGWHNKPAWKQNCADFRVAKWAYVNDLTDNGD